MFGKKDSPGRHRGPVFFGMEAYSIIAVALIIASLGALINKRFIRVSSESIGLLLGGLVMAVALLIFEQFVPGTVDRILRPVADLDFSVIVLDLLLGFLIFAGAYSSDTRSLSRERMPILVFATIGILISTFAVGFLTKMTLDFVGIEVPLLHCLLFGALISPTDPVAVLAILKGTAVPKSLQADIAGESLLNDGVAVVVFTTIYFIAQSGAGGGAAGLGFSDIAMTFGREVLGGLVLGWIVGWLGIRAIKLAASSNIDVLITVALVMGGYAIAHYLEVSGPLAMVVSGLMISKVFDIAGSSKSEKEHLDVFWEALDSIFNAVLFSLLGLLLLSLSRNDYEGRYLLACLLVIPVVLLSRLISLAFTIPLTSLRKTMGTKKAFLLTWGGLRGGISVALALSLQEEMSKDIIVYLTYGVVVFSVVVQGLTIGKLVTKLGLK